MSTNCFQRPPHILLELVATSKKNTESKPSHLLAIVFSFDTVNLQCVQGSGGEA
jgi:hypothetical protein